MMYFPDHYLKGRIADLEFTFNVRNMLGPEYMF